MNELVDISIKDCLLCSAFDSQASLNTHLDNYIKNENSAVLVVQFPAQLTSLDNVSACLFMLSWIPAFMKGLQYKAQHPFRLISVHTQGDWFLETSGDPQTCRDVYEFIMMRSRGELPKQQMLVKEKVKKIRTVYKKRIQNTSRMIGKNQFVQRVSKPVPTKEEYWADTEVPRVVEVDKIGNVPIAEVDKVIHQIKRLEIFGPNRQIQAADFAINK